MITLVIVIIAVSVMVLFSVQNAAPVVVSFLSWKFGASLAVIIVLSRAHRHPYRRDNGFFLSAQAIDQKQKGHVTRDNGE